MRRTRQRTAAGTTLVEVLIAMSVMVIGYLGVASLQVLSVRTNQFGRRMAQASELAFDLEENVRRWPYNDTRLSPLETVTSMGTATILQRWDMGRDDDTSYTAQYSDAANDQNAISGSALGASYQGLSADVDGDGTADFTRYWTVAAVDLASTGTPNGKLVQIVVRWREANLGWRQVTASAFKLNPASATQ